MPQSTWIVSMLLVFGSSESNERGLVIRLACNAKDIVHIGVE